MQLQEIQKAWIKEFTALIASFADSPEDLSPKELAKKIKDLEKSMFEHSDLEFETQLQYVTS